MKYSFNTWAYSSFPVWLPAYTLKETIERIARVGYDALEVGCASPHAWPYYLDAQKRKDICRWLKDNHIVISSMLPVLGGGPGANAASAIKEEREWTMQYSKDICDLAGDVGCSLLLYIAGWCIYGTKQQDAWNYSLDSLVQIATYAAKKGITVVIEPTPEDSNVVETAYDAMYLKEQTGLDNIGIMFDTAHAFYRNEPPADYVYQIGKELTHVHVTDYDRQAPGTNGCDFLPLMQALKDIDYKGYVTMETGFTSRNVQPDSIARLSIEHLKAIEKILK
jgi:fructoselysine 3-epimerase